MPVADGAVELMSSPEFDTILPDARPASIAVVLGELEADHNLCVQIGEQICRHVKEEYSRQYAAECVFEAC